MVCVAPTLSEQLLEELRRCIPRLGPPSCGSCGAVSRMVALESKLELQGFAQLQGRSHDAKRRTGKAALSAEGPELPADHGTGNESRALHITSPIGMRSSAEPALNERRHSECYGQASLSQ